MTRQTLAKIDLSALKHNLSVVKQLAPHSKILAMIKSNAYGHGMTRVANALTRADLLGVAFFDEANALRESGCQHPLLILQGFIHADELRVIAEKRFQITVYDQQQLQLLLNTPVQQRLKVWFKIDTGMHRLGFLPEEVPQAVAALKACPWVDPDLVFMTHFSNADDLSDFDTTLTQTALLSQMTTAYPGERSLANSAAILRFPQTHADWVRPGIMLYGVSPFDDKIGLDHGLRPVMTLESEIISVKWCHQGEAVGYRRTWYCPEDMPIAIVAIGYGDGYPRTLPSGTPLSVEGHPSILLGRVSMDMIAIDLRSCPQAKIGDRVELWGSYCPVETIERLSHVFRYQLLCNIAQRVQYQYKE